MHRSILFHFLDRNDARQGMDIRAPFATTLRAGMCVAVLSAMGPGHPAMAQLPVAAPAAEIHITPSPLALLARIQTDLERVAAGKPRLELANDEARDALELLVDAYAAYISGDNGQLEISLGALTEATAARLAALDPSPPHQ
jgi:hypothetical protein